MSFTEGSDLEPLEGTPIWITSMPKKGWDGFRAIFESPTEGGVVTMNRYWKHISQGEPIWVWQNGSAKDDPGIVAAGVVCGEPYVVVPYEDYPLKDNYGLDVYVGIAEITERDRSLKHTVWVPIDAVKVFDRRIPKADLLETGDAFRDLTIVKRGATMGSMHKATPEADLAIRSLLSPEDQPWPPVPLPSLDLPSEPEGLERVRSNQVTFVERPRY